VGWGSVVAAGLGWAVEADSGLEEEKGSGSEGEVAAGWGWAAEEGSD